MSTTPSNAIITAAKKQDFAGRAERMRAERGWTREFMIRCGDGTPMVMNVATITIYDRGRLIGTVGVSYLDDRHTLGSMRS